MARIRTIKPEFFTSVQVVECSPTARLLFVGLWCFADDGGVHPASAKRVKMEVFPGDSFTTDDIDGWIAELIENELLIEFSHENQQFWHITGWKHQKIDKPNFRYPSPTIRRPFDDHSTTAHPRKGKEGKGKEEDLLRYAQKGESGDSPPPDSKKQLWDMGISLLGDKSRSLIGKAIKNSGEAKVAEVLSHMAVSAKADPVTYFTAACTGNPEGSAYDRS